VPDSFEIFKTYLSEICSVSKFTWDTLLPLLEVKSIKRSTLIAEEKKNYNNELFIVSGIVRLFYLGDGNEINIAFFKGPETLSPYFSRNINGKHSCYIETLTDTEIIEFNAESFSELIRSNNEIQRFAYHVVENELKNKIQREKLFLTQNAEKRLLSFREKYKGLENEISHYHIASYLGINPVSLSRLRKKIK